MLSHGRVEDIFRESEALITGHFILASGRHAGEYMNCARIMQHPRYAEELASGLAEQFRDSPVDVVIGPATGGIVLAHETARQLGARSLFAERQNGKMALRRGFDIPPEARVLVVEDTVTTGGTVLEVLDLVHALGGRAVGVGVLVDRSMGVVTFGVPCRSLLVSRLASYSPDECPMCREGREPAVRPGSSRVGQYSRSG